MRILVIGAGGVGAAAAAIARRRDFFERLVLADVDGARAEREAARLGDERIGAAQLDAASSDDIVALARAQRAGPILNARDPRPNPPHFAGAPPAGRPHPDLG